MFPLEFAGLSRIQRAFSPSTHMKTGVKYYFLLFDAANAETFFVSLF
jgi:hypothetical protein